MGLWEDKATGNFYMFGDDGSKELAIEFTKRQIRIRTPLLRRYQAARQLDLGIVRFDVDRLPPGIERATTRLLEELNLKYAASDFIVDRDGRFHFLEANPHGAWLWLEDALGEARFTSLFAQAIVDTISEEKLYN